MTQTIPEERRTQPVGDSPRCVCGHVELHHGAIDNQCGHTACSCKSFTQREAGRSAEADSPVAADQVRIPVPASALTADAIFMLLGQISEHASLGTRAFEMHSARCSVPISECLDTLAEMWREEYTADWTARWALLEVAGYTVHDLTPVGGAS